MCASASFGSSSAAAWKPRQRVGQVVLRQRQEAERVLQRRVLGVLLLALLEEQLGEVEAVAVLLPALHVDQAVDRVGAHVLVVDGERVRQLLARVLLELAPGRLVLGLAHLGQVERRQVDVGGGQLGVGLDRALPVLARAVDLAGGEVQLAEVGDRRAVVGLDLERGLVGVLGLLGQAAVVEAAAHHVLGLDDVAVGAGDGRELIGGRATARLVPAGGGRLVVEVERAGVVGLGVGRHLARRVVVLGLDGRDVGRRRDVGVALLQARRRLLAAAAGDGGEEERGSENVGEAHGACLFEIESRTEMDRSRIVGRRAPTPASTPAARRRRRPTRRRARRAARRRSGTLRA
jgi:hypothetical protein